MKPLTDGKMISNSFTVELCEDESVFHLRVHPTLWEFLYQALEKQGVTGKPVRQYTIQIGTK